MNNLVKVVRHGFVFWEVEKPAPKPLAELPAAALDKTYPPETLAKMQASARKQAEARRGAK